MAVVHSPAEGDVRIGSLMASYPALQFLTWLLEVMPLSFALGGASSVIAWRRADVGDVLHWSWMWGRARRLMRPVPVYLAIMAVLGAAMTLLAGPQMDPLLSSINGRLWLLGVCPKTPLFLPFMWWAHQKNRDIAFLVLVQLAVVDSVGVTILGWPVWVGFLTLILGWVAIQPLGFL